MSLDRRKFLQKFGLGTGGAIASVSIVPGVFEQVCDWLASLKSVYVQSHVIAAEKKLTTVWYVEHSHELMSFHSFEVEEQMKELITRGGWNETGRYSN